MYLVRVMSINVVVLMLSVREVYKAILQHWKWSELNPGVGSNVVLHNCPRLTGCWCTGWWRCTGCTSGCCWRCRTWERKTSQCRGSHPQNILPYLPGLMLFGGERVAMLEVYNPPSPPSPTVRGSFGKAFLLSTIFPLISWKWISQILSTTSSLSKVTKPKPLCRFVILS